MALTWRERLIQEPELADIRRWPLVDTQRLAPCHRKAYQRNLSIVAQALDGTINLSAIAAANGVSPSLVTKLMTRCLAGPAEEPPQLSRALIPHKRLQKSQRQSPLSRLTACRGSRCSFTHLLQTVPGLQHYLDKMIRASVKRAAYGQNLKPAPFHAAFIRYLEERGWPRDTYPFTETSRGYESLRQYLNRKCTEISLPKSPSRVILTSRASNRIFSQIQIDEQTVDCNGSVVLILNEQLESLRLSRITLLQARDAGTGCTLAFTIALTKKVRADDILTLFELMTQPWEPPTLKTPGLAYEPGACLPSSLHADFRRPAFGIVRMDNALEHLAHSVRDIVCRRLHATLNYGPPAQPKGRNVIEQAFDLLNHPVHRFASTTGSHVQDSIREDRKNRRKPPVLSLQSLEEVISVILVNNNLRVLANMGAKSPLGQARYQMANHLLPLRPTLPDTALRPYWSSRRVIIRKVKNDPHAPHINFEKVQYQGEAINRADLINREVNVEFDRRDIRVLRVTTLDGEYLGEVIAPKTWQRFPHSLTTRKYINELIRKETIERQDPLGKYFDYLLDRRHNPKDAMEMLRVGREFGATAAISPPDPAPQPEDRSRQELSNTELEKALKEIPDWNPDMVRKRK